MTSIIKVDNLQNQCGANIISESANVITIGASGDTVTLAAGASQSGFGRTGTVNWDTTPKTTTPITSVSGNGYFINTTSIAITVNLPSTPAAGDIVAIADYANTSATNNITVGRNGSLIDGFAINGTISTNGQVYTLVYVDATEGWKTVGQTFNQIITAEFVAATGGTIATCGDYKIHTFTGPGTFTVTNAGNAGGSNSVEILAVGGGGGGAADNGGGAGAGAVASNSSVPISATAYPIVIGGGGAAGLSGGGAGEDGSTGVSTTFFGNTIRAGSGGKGSNSPGTIPGTYSNGGGGAGVADVPAAQVGPGVSGVAHPAIPGYTISAGNSGGNGRFACSPANPGPGNKAAGGAGAGGNGTSAVCVGGPGGNGVQNNITGTNHYWGGGGGGGTFTGTGGNGGLGGGGGGGGGYCGPNAGGTGGGSALNSGSNGGPGTPGAGGSGGTGGANTGGGGGGAGRNSPSPGGAGGSGIVVIKYKFQ